MNAQKIFALLLVLVLLTQPLALAEDISPELLTVAESAAAVVVSGEGEVQEMPPAAETSVAEETPMPEISPAQSTSPEETPVPEESAVSLETPVPEDTPVPDAPSAPEETPAPEATAASTQEPAPEESPEPTVEVTAEPTPVPTDAPSTEPSIGPSAEPSLEPTCAPSAVEILPERSSLVLGVSEKADISAYTLLPEGAVDDVQFISSHRYLSVSAKGVLSARKAGTYTVTLLASGGASAKIQVSVRKAPEKVNLSIDRKSAAVGETIACTASIPAKSAGSWSWASSNPDVLFSNGDGSFLAVGAGSAKITVTTYNGRSASASVTVSCAGIHIPQRVLPHPWSGRNPRPHPRCIRRRSALFLLR